MSFGSFEPSSQLSCTLCIKKCRIRTTIGFFTIMKKEFVKPEVKEVEIDTVICDGSSSGDYTPPVCPRF